MDKEASEQPAAVKALMEVSIIAHLSDLLFARHLPPGLTTAQYGVLNRLVRLGLEETMSEVAAAFRVAPATMSSTIEKLKQKGLVELSTCPKDGRRKLVQITTAGRALQREGIVSQMALIEQYGSFINEAEWDRMNSLLNSVRLELEKAMNDYGITR